MMDDLLTDYPTVIGLMPRDRDFTNHEFILALAQRKQVDNITALGASTTSDAPFRDLHMQLPRALHDFPSLVRHTGEVDSDDIFCNPGRCASWQQM